MAARTFAMNFLSGAVELLQELPLRYCAVAHIPTTVEPQ